MKRIEAVIGDLDAVVAECINKSLRMGYFAAMYRRVTASVSDALAEDRFADNDRMEELDVVFAQRFLDAWAHHRAGRTPTSSWQLAIRATQTPRQIIAQHLLLGMNAHINLDLGIATAKVADMGEADTLHADFLKINDILGSAMRTLLDDLGSLSPWIGILDAVGGRRDDQLIRFSIDVARDEAWAFAQQLATLDAPDWNAAINRRDRATELVGRAVLSPGPIISPAIWLVRQRESNDVAEVIRRLRD